MSAGEFREQKQKDPKRRRLQARANDCASLTAPCPSFRAIYEATAVFRRRQASYRSDAAR